MIYLILTVNLEILCTLNTTEAVLQTDDGRFSMYYFIVNPNSHSGDGIKIWKKLEKQLDHDSVDYEAYLTREPGDARTAARKLTEGCKEPVVIVAVGGDGTVNEIVDGMAFCGPVTMGLIPTGSGNDLARSLRLPKNPRRCLKKILHPKYHKLLDYGVMTYGDGQMNHRRFMVSAGIGMDAAVCHNLLYSGTKRFFNRLRLNHISFIIIGCKQLLLAKPSKGYILLDGVKKIEFNHIYFISAHIHPYEGGGFKFAPEADCSDGKLEVCVASHQSKRKLLPILASALTRKHKRFKGMRCYACQEALIHIEKPMAVHTDGESCLSQQELHIRCIQKKIRMIV